ncbi:MAG: class IV adenylate cyclase [Candidatus Falkowbacteria bacterium]
MKNIELKVAVKNFNEIKKLLKKNSAKPIGVLRQIDTYYTCQKGRLKIREINNKEFEILFYQRSDKKRSKISDYEMFRLKPCQLNTMKRIFGRAYGVKVVVKKKRELWIYKNTRIHLDRVNKLGNFLELETVVKNISLEQAQKEHQGAIGLLNFGKYKRINGSYSDLLK